MQREPSGTRLSLGDGCGALALGCSAKSAVKIQFNYQGRLRCFCYAGYFLNILATALSISCMFFCEFFWFNVP
jgi:hypothetical protein